MGLSKIKTLHTFVKKELEKGKWQNKNRPLSYIKVAADMTRSTKTYRVIPDEYIALDFYDLDDERRKQIVSRKERNQIVKTFNSNNDMDKVENKKQFLVNFKAYLNRDFLLLEDTSYEAFDEFCLQHGGFVAKISDSGQGKDVQIITEVDDTFETYHRLKSQGVDVIEEIAEPHPELKRINPVGLPSIRVITFVDDEGQPHIVSSALNMSFDDPVVNTYRGGIKALLNPEDGRVVTDAIGKSGKVYTEHPVSNVTLSDYQVPEWGALKAMLHDAALEIPSVRYIGWDVSVSDKGPLLIEGNAKRPDINGIQIIGYNKADETYSKFDFVREELKKAIK